MTVRKRVRIQGRVQGVFFRDSVRSEARSRRVGGWVRNCDDGTVEAVFEGETSDVETLVAFCRSGPPAADVLDIDVAEETPQGEPGFSVR